MPLDAINETLVRQDVLNYLPNITEDAFRKLTAYSIAGAGVAGMEPVLRTISPPQLEELHRMFHVWLAGRNLTDFFHTLFEDFGYTCREVSVLEM